MIFSSSSLKLEAFMKRIAFIILSSALKNFSENYIRLTIHRYDFS